MAAALLRAAAPLLLVALLARAAAGPAFPVNATRVGALTCPDNWSCCKLPTTLVCADASPPCTSCPDCCQSYLNGSQCSACHAAKCGGVATIGDMGCHANKSSTWTPYTEYCCGRGLPKPASTALPNCLLVGDSVMHGASSLVIAALAGECETQIFVGNDAAGEAACWGAASAEAATGAPVGFDVIHYNEGLHSLYPRTNTTDASGVTWAAVLSNWSDVLALPGPGGAKPPSLIYAPMTPMMAQRVCNPPGVPAHNVEALNALALQTVRAKGVPVNDLYSVITGFCGAEYVNCSICDNEAKDFCPQYAAAGGVCGFHYVTLGWELLANTTVTAIRAALAARRAAAGAAASPPLSAAGAAELSSPLLRMGVAVDAAGAVAVNVFSFFGAGANTTNLALPVMDAQSSSSLLVLGAQPGQALVPSCGAGCSLAGGGSGAGATLTLAGLTTSLPAAAGGALLATETWTLTLQNDSAVSWRVDRVWAAAGAGVSVDRFGLSLATTGGQPIHSQQIPGFVDLGMFFNETSTGGFDIGNGAFEYLSAQSRQFVRFTPTGALFVIEGASAVDGVAAPLLWSFAKPFADGTTWCSIGFESVDPRGGARPAFAAGTTQRLEMTLHLVETDVPTDGPGAGPFPALTVALPNATLHAQMMTLFSSQYQLMGFILGNNPASSPCLHEQAWWPMMASALDAGSVAFAAMQQELSFFAKCGWSPGQAGGSGDYEHEHSCSLADGAAYGLTQRYSSTGFYNCPWGPLTDQDVMFPIAIWFAATSSGDLAWLARMRPALDATAAYLASRGLTVPSSRAVFVSPASGIADGGRHAANWCAECALARVAEPVGCCPATRSPVALRAGTTSSSSATSTPSSPCTASGRCSV